MTGARALIVAVICGGGGLFVAARGPLAASIVAVIFLLPFAFIALIAAHLKNLAQITGESLRASDQE